MSLLPGKMACEMCDSGQAALYCKHLLAYVCDSCHAKLPDELHYCSYTERAPQSPGVLGPENGRGPQVSEGVA